MVIIRLARGGSKKKPFYSMVVTDSRNRRDGRFIERLGFYNPLSSSLENKLKVSLDRVVFWKNNGACLSPVVERLVSEYSKNVNCV